MDTITVYVDGKPQERRYTLDNRDVPGRVGEPKGPEEKKVPVTYPGETRSFVNGRWEIRYKPGGM